MSLAGIDLIALRGLNAFTRTLTAQDVNNCVSVEQAFPEHERCSEEKFQYRLTVSPENCLGLFIEKENKQALIGHVIATWSPYTHITDGAMLMPKDWQSLPQEEPVYAEGELVGNDRSGDTIAVHSVAILPEYQGKKIGRTLMRLYIQRLQKTPSHAKRVVLIAHDHLVPFYESVGFKNQGPSECKFGGGGWIDMALEL